jgi:hypothetical protein
MNNQYFKKTALAALVAGMASLSTSISAEEGGTGHYAIGGLATMVDVPPTDAGWVVQPLYLHYEGKSDNPLPFTAGTGNANDITAKVDAFVLGGVYTFENELFGAHYSVGVYVPYVWMDVTATTTKKIPATIAGQDIPAGTVVNQKADGLGDITFIPVMLAWKPDDNNWQYSFALPVYAPTGDYDKTRIANQGVNYWTVDPTVIASYSNLETGLNFTGSMGYTFNTENDDTNYQSGSVLHMEGSAQQLLPLGAGFASVGVNVFLYEQVTGDSGEGAVYGDFKGSSYGVGPVIGYVLPTANSGTGVLEFRWLPELNTKNRLKGDYIWLKGGWQF